MHQLRSNFSLFARSSTIFVAMRRGMPELPDKRVITCIRAADSLRMPLATKHESVGGVSANIVL